MATSLNDFNQLKVLWNWRALILGFCQEYEILLNENLISLQDQLNKALGDASVVVKASCGLIALFYFLGYIPHVYDALAVTPGL